MPFQSEIRPSQVNDLLEKVQNKNYGKYLLKISIEKARAFQGRSINFDFPVTAIVGINGGGKTTVLGAAACAYKTVKPSLFFAKSGRFDSSMQNWKFEYELIDKQIKSSDTVRRTAKFARSKWSREWTVDGIKENERTVAVFGVSRTVPANERPELQRCASNSFDVDPEFIDEISSGVAGAVASILDKDISAFSFLRVDTRGRVTLLAGQTSVGDSYSEFHFGAGESSVIRMAIKLETIPENSLVLIEEIENGLHPVATVRMVEYLIDLALRRKIQVIFTTHSNDALKPLPDKAIWAAANGNLYQGKLDIASLRAISGQIDSQLVVFVEDSFARTWVEEILRSLPGVAMDAVSVHPMEGDGTAVTVHRGRKLDPSVSQPSVCLIDGDSKQQDSPTDSIYRLPGQSPESYIYDKVAEKLDEISGELAVALLRPYEEEAKVAEIIRSVRNTNRDPHLLYSQVGKRLGLIPEARVREAFITLWARTFPDEVKSITQPFIDKIPLESNEISIAI
ncbi:ATP-dependent nuclease [Leptolyngbya ohadii]|uniref:ATP-dependent nuclease n=1 Tax=Leptolyngbya ohadii TaxID=1962290 RepID=UPI000B59FEEA|nr:AAA family ATPase [Leptolyngbya ohadii]